MSQYTNEDEEEIMEERHWLMLLIFVYVLTTLSFIWLLLSSYQLQ